MKRLHEVSWLGALAVVAGCHAAQTTAEAAPERRPASSALAVQAGSPSMPAPSVPVGADPGHLSANPMGGPLTPTGEDKLAAFAAGCFWGVEDAFRHVPGVTATAVGFTGGHTTNPDYEKVCTHTTGHAETVLVEFDPARVPYERLLQVFFKIHDPTQVDRQGPDVGDQYRSAIFTFSDEEAAAAKAAKQSAEKSLGHQVATQIRPIGPFYKAEGYHQQYAERTGHHGCPIRADLETL